MALLLVSSLYSCQPECDDLVIFQSTQVPAASMTVEFETIRRPMTYCDCLVQIQHAQDLQEKYLKAFRFNVEQNPSDTKWATMLEIQEQNPPKFDCVKE